MPILFFIALSGILSASAQEDVAPIACNAQVLLAKTHVVESEPSPSLWRVLLPKGQWSLHWTNQDSQLLAVDAGSGQSLMVNSLNGTLTKLTSTVESQLQLTDSDVLQVKDGLVVSLSSRRGQDGLPGVIVVSRLGGGGITSLGSVELSGEKLQAAELVQNAKGESQLAVLTNQSFALYKIGENQILRLSSVPDLKIPQGLRRGQLHSLSDGRLLVMGETLDFKIHFYQYSVNKNLMVERTELLRNHLSRYPLQAVECSKGTVCLVSLLDPFKDQGRVKLHMETILGSSTSEYTVEVDQPLSLGQWLDLGSKGMRFVMPTLSPEGQSSIRLFDPLLKSELSLAVEDGRWLTDLIFLRWRSGVGFFYRQGKQLVFTAAGATPRDDAEMARFTSALKGFEIQQVTVDGKNQRLAVLRQGAKGTVVDVLANGATGF